LVFLIKYSHVNKIKENEKGGACDMYGGRTRTYKMLTGRVRERDRMEDLGVDGQIILKWIFKK